MANIISFDEFIKEGNVLLSFIPKKNKFTELESTIKDKYDDSKQKSKRDIQLKYLREEHTKKIKEAQQKYLKWFEECNVFLNKFKEKSYSSGFTQTKQNLELESRIKSALEVLIRAKKEIEKSNKSISELQHDDVNIKIENIIKGGETDKVEFKSSLRWDFKTNGLNKFLEIVVMKTISAFLNSSGGTLLIGIDDQGNTLGIEKDYPTLKKQDGDGFIQYLVQVMNNKLGKEYNQYISAFVKSFNGNDICIIEVKPSATPVFIKYDNKEEFYIRASATSQPLNVREATEYIKMHWK
jgi:hypothetical protein